MKKYSIFNKFSEVNVADWSEFVKNHSQGNVFQSPEIFETYEKIANFTPNFIVVKEENAVVGCLVSVIQKEAKGFLGKLTSRSIIMGGPLAKDNDLEIISLLIEEYKKSIGNKAIYSQFRNLFDFSFAHEVFISQGFKCDKHLDILIDISQQIETIRKNISKNKRGNISKSLNKGAVFIEVNDKSTYLECVKLIRNTYKKIGLPCPTDAYFVTFFDELHKVGILKAFALEIDKKLIGTRLELCYNNTVYDWWAGADDGYKNCYPNDVIPFQILVWGHENGYRTFDFGGAGKPDVPYGVRDHKMKFGGELVEFGRYEMVHKPLLMSMGKAGLLIYKKLKQYVGS